MKMDFGTFYRMRQRGRDGVNNDNYPSYENFPSSSGQNRNYSEEYSDFGHPPQSGYNESYGFGGQDTNLYEETGEIHNYGTDESWDTRGGRDFSMDGYSNRGRGGGRGRGFRVSENAMNNSAARRMGQYENQGRGNVRGASFQSKTWGFGGRRGEGQTRSMNQAKTDLPRQEDFDFDFQKASSEPEIFQFTSDSAENTSEDVALDSQTNIPKEGDSDNIAQSQSPTLVPATQDHIVTQENPHPQENPCPQENPNHEENPHQEEDKKDEEEQGDTADEAQSQKESGIGTEVTTQDSSHLMNENMEEDKDEVNTVNEFEDKTIDDDVEDSINKQLEDPDATAYHCPVCYITANARKSFQAHLIGKQHLAKYETFLKGRSSSQVKPQKKMVVLHNIEDMGKYSFVKEALKESTKQDRPIIGLSYVTEYHCLYMVKCVCSICGVTFFSRQSEHHLGGFRHSINVVRERRPRAYAYLKPFGARRNVLSPMLTSVVKEIAATEGIGNPTLSVLKPFPDKCTLHKDYTLVNVWLFVDIGFYKLMVFQYDEHKDLLLKAGDKYPADTQDEKIVSAYYIYVHSEYKRAKEKVERMAMEQDIPLPMSAIEFEEHYSGHGSWNPKKQDHEFPPRDPYMPIPPPGDPYLRHPRFHGRYPALPEPPLDRPLYPPPRPDYDPFYRRRPLPHDPYLSHEALMRMRRNDLYFDREKDPLSTTDPLKRLKTDDYLDRDPLKRQSRSMPYMDPDPLKRLRKVEPRPINPHNFNEPYIDPDPLKRVLPSQKAAKKPVVIDYGHGSEKKSAKTKADEWEKDIKDILNESKGPDSLAQLSCSYSSPKKEESPPHQPKRELPFSKSYIERSKLFGKEASSSRKERSPDFPKRERVREQDRSRSPNRKYRSSESPERGRHKSRFYKDSLKKDSYHSEGRLSPPPRKSRRKSSVDKDYSIRKYKRSRSPENLKMSGEKDRIYMKRPYSRSPELSLEVTRPVPDVKRRPKGSDIVIDLTEEEEIRDAPKEKVISPKPLPRVDNPDLDFGKEQASSSKADMTEIEDVQAEMIAEMLLKMKNSVVGQDADPQTALTALLSQDITQVLLATKEVTEKTSDSPTVIKKARHNEIELSSPNRSREGKTGDPFILDREGKVSDRSSLERRRDNQVKEIIILDRREQRDIQSQSRRERSMEIEENLIDLISFDRRREEKSRDRSNSRSREDRDRERSSLERGHIGRINRSYNTRQEEIETDRSLENSRSWGSSSGRKYDRSREVSVRERDLFEQGNSTSNMIASYGYERQREERGRDKRGRTSLRREEEESGLKKTREVNRSSDKPEFNIPPREKIAFSFSGRGSLPVRSALSSFQDEDEDGD